MKDLTLVVFRVYRKDGDVLALFPQEKYSDTLCMSYQHVGQHSGADYSHCISLTKPATPKQYKDLKSELERLGYNLIVRKRFTRSK